MNHAPQTSTEYALPVTQPDHQDQGFQELTNSDGVIASPSNASVHEEALHELAIFRQYVELAPDAVLVADATGKIELVNRQTETLFGYRRSELLGQPIEFLIPARFRSPHPGYRTHYMDHPHTRPMGAGLELFGLRADGSEFPVEISLSPIRVDETLKVISTIRDVSDRKRAEQALRVAQHESARRASELEATFNAITDAVVIFDRTGNILRANPVAELAFGVTAETEQSGETMEARFLVAPPRDSHGQPLSRDAWVHRRLLSGETFTGANASDMVFTTPSGQDIVLNIAGAPIRDQDGHVIGAVLIGRDVTAQRRLERSARAEAEARRALLQLVIDELPSGVYLVQGRDARLVLANRAAEAVWGTAWPEGQPMQAFLATSGTSILGTDGRALTPDQLATIQAVRSGSAVRHHQEIIRHPDGAALPVLLNAVALDLSFLGLSSVKAQEIDGANRDDEGVAKEHGALVVVQDVTALKEAERLKDEFITIAAHELKTPMAAVKGYAEMFLRAQRRPDTAPLAGWQVEALDAIDEATDRLAQLTEDLLDVTRLQAGRLSLHCEPHDLVALARRVAQRLQVTTTRHVLSVESDADYVVANIDIPRMEQVLTNLVNNAIKYSPTGGEVRLHVYADNEAGLAEVLVQDQGIGIPADQQARIFGRFSRAENAQNMGITGTGLGLYLSRELVERHDGRIWFASTEGKGTTFYVALPLLHVE